MNIIYLINFTSVGIFGMVLSSAFCDISWTRKKYSIMTGGLAVILILQGMVYFFIDASLAERCYPVTTHIPLVLMLSALGGKRLWPVISVMTAYLCCQIRRWLALLVTAILSGDPMMQSIVELAVTIPLLFLLVRFAAPAVRSVSHYPASVQWRFGLIPVLYYGFDYLTRIYTNLLTEGVLVAVEFMPFVCCMAYLIFVLQNSEAERVRGQLEQTQKSLNIQIAQAVREIEALRESQNKTRVYRHDLRHHMQYLSSCIENGRQEQALAYIQEISSEIEANKVTFYCENEVVNLIFSAFAERAERDGIPIEIKAAVPQSVPISESDLCVLLSNALENALYACKKRKENGLSARIEVSVYERKGKFFLQIINSCDGDVIFVKGIPVANERGHGIGVNSICAIVEKYSDIYMFQAKDDQFILRVSF